MSIPDSAQNLGLLSQRVLKSFDNPPANAVYLDAADSLFVSIASSVASINLTLNVRVLADDGQINITSQPFVTTGSRIFSGSFIPAGQGLLLSISIRSAPFSGCRRGMVFANATLVRGGTTATGVTTQPLFAGYVTDMEFIAYPPGVFEAGYSGYGNIRSITGTQPALGADILETVPFGAVWRLKSFRFSVTTSATVANRTSALLIDDGTNILWFAWPNQTFAASLTAAVNYAELMPTGALNQTQQSAGFPADVLLLSGWRIRTQSFGLQSGDQVSAPQYCVEEWIQQ